MTEELRFFIYLLERYGASKGVSGGEMLAQLDAKGLTEFVISLYDLYHVERLENAFADIDELLAHGLPATAPESFYGFVPLPPRGETVCNDLVDAISEDEDIEESVRAAAPAVVTDQVRRDG
ncbi:MAG: DUF3791 domain-containing protein [Propionibacteriaceae bacterium]|jgi:hypothetical protein|nr:DUF3791 domain-containing protein [Propionibacteriaceae bacterium]